VKAALFLQFWKAGVNVHIALDAAQGSRLGLARREIPVEHDETGRVGGVRRCTERSRRKQSSNNYETSRSQVCLSIPITLSAVLGTAQPHNNLITTPVMKIR
jgi:hypothetical protein